MTFPYTTKLQDINALSQADWLDVVEPKEYEALMSTFRSGGTVTVDLCTIPVDNDPEGSYYTVTFANGVVIEDLHGRHLVDMPHVELSDLPDTSTPSTIGLQYVFSVNVYNYKDGSPINHSAAQQIFSNALAAAKKQLEQTIGYQVSIGNVTFETDFPIQDDLGPF